MKKYKVAFVERTDGKGRNTENPPGFVELDLADGVVLDQVFVERTLPESLHVQEAMDEDDSFESMATEVWEYTVADGRDADFLDAVWNSRIAVDVQELEGDEEIIR